MCTEPCRPFQERSSSSVDRADLEFREMGNCFGKNERVPIPRDEALDTSPLKNNRALIIFVVGGPGVGKGTLCEKLASKYGMLVISVSNILRKEVAKRTAKGQRYQELMAKGLSIPADIIVQLVVRQMLEKPNAYGYLVIGFPRNKKQALMFNRLVRRPSLILNLYVRRVILQRRLMQRLNEGRRFDDTPEALMNRIKAYYILVSRAIKLNKAVTRVINAEVTVSEVFKQACKIIDDVIRKESEGR